MTTLTQILTEDRALRPLALDGVTPTLQSLAAGISLLQDPAPGHRRNPSPLAKDFVAFVRSPAGQAVLARSGNLALAGISRPMPSPDSGLARTIRLIAAAIAVIIAFSLPLGYWLVVYSFAAEADFQRCRRPTPIG